LVEALGKIERTIDLLERQECVCLPSAKKPRVQCLRCELLEILR